MRAESAGLRSTLAHLRFPFSFFLLPVFLAALALAGSIEVGRAVAALLVMHFLLYPASQGFNSYYDRDLGPIGGLRSPPPIHATLLPASLALDLAALVAGTLLCGPLFGLGLLAYGLSSKLYSWDRSRWKARPFAGWLMTGLGQGGLTFCLVIVAVDRGGLSALGPGVWAAALAISVLLLGVFPLTQVYQHAEDEARGDLTISRLLGLRGTFMLAGLCLSAGLLGLATLVGARSGPPWALALLLFQAPAALFFGTWFGRVLRDPGAADFASAMRMNLLASGLLNLYFVLYLAFAGRGSFHV